MAMSFDQREGGTQLHMLVAEGYVVRLDRMQGFGLGYKIPRLLAMAS
jgi:hypothetical protein